MHITLQYYIVTRNGSSHDLLRPATRRCSFAFVGRELPSPIYCSFSTYFKLATKILVQDQQLSNE